MKWALRAVVGAILCVSLVFGANILFVDHPAQSELKKDLRNSGLTFRVHWRHWIDFDSLVIDIRSAQSSSMADVDRSLMQIAAALAERKYSHVYLAHEGAEKYRLEGEYFREVGLEYGVQNPVYVIRTLPEDVQTVNGTSAFPRWTGGLIGVLNKQMEDHAEFHQGWWAQ